LHYCLAPDGLLDGPSRIVFNCTYLWAAKIITGALMKGALVLPKSVKELVFHFKKVGGERPRFMRCRIEGDSHEFLEPFTTASRLPPLKPDEHFHPLPMLQPFRYRTLFDRIAELYAKACTNRGSLKLYLVGLDELDRELKREEEGNDAFEAIFGRLGFCLHNVPRWYWHQPAYQSIEHSFLDQVLQRVPKGKRELAKNDVKIMSSSEYIAHLTPERRTEEDWWWSPADDAREC
jgi:hypothetical protein